MRKLLSCIPASLVLAGCEAGILPPESCAPTGDQSLYIEETLDVDVCFTDPDGGGISLAAQSSNPEIVKTHAEQASIVLEGISVGEAVITITATDPDGDIAEEMITATVPNRNPTIRGKIAPIQMTEERYRTESQSIKMVYRSGRS